MNKIKGAAAQAVLDITPPLIKVFAFFDKLDDDTRLATGEAARVMTHLYFLRRALNKLNAKRVSGEPFGKKDVGYLLAVILYVPYIVTGQVVGAHDRTTKALAALDRAKARRGGSATTKPHFSKQDLDNLDAAVEALRGYGTDDSMKVLMDSLFGPEALRTKPGGSSAGS